MPPWTNEESEARTGPLLTQVTPLGNGRVSPKDSGSRARGSGATRAGVRSVAKRRLRSRTGLGARASPVAHLASTGSQRFQLCGPAGAGLVTPLVFMVQKLGSLTKRLPELTQLDLRCPALD